MCPLKSVLLKSFYLRVLLFYGLKYSVHLKNIYKIHNYYKKDVAEPFNPGSNVDVLYITAWAGLESLRIITHYHY